MRRHELHICLCPYMDVEWWTKIHEYAQTCSQLFKSQSRRFRKGIEPAAVPSRDINLGVGDNLAKSDTHPGRDGTGAIEAAL